MQQNLGQIRGDAKFLSGIGIIERSTNNLDYNQGPCLTVF